MTGHRAIEPAGWRQDPWDTRMVRYHDGTEWTPHVQPAIPVQMQPVQPAPIYVHTPAQYQPTMFVTEQRKPTSHLFHLVMTILTGGFWGLFVWFPIILWHKIGPKKKTVTRAR